MSEANSKGTSAARGRFSADVSLDELTPRKGAKAIRARRQPAAGGGNKGGSSKKRTAMRSAALAKTPQAVVKVIGFTHSQKSIRRQVNYITRDGQMLENQAAALDGGDGLADRVIEDWGKKAEPQKTKNGKPDRLSMHLAIAMPAGTDVEDFREIAREWGERVFPGRQYVYAVHEDKQHPHAHFLVALRDDNGKKLNPRKDDLQAWREAFAEIRTEKGYPTAATRWYEHRQDRPPREASHSPSWRMLERGEVSDKVMGLLRAVAGPPTPPAPLPPAVEASQSAHRDEAARYAAEGKGQLAELHQRAAETPRRGRVEALREELAEVAAGRSPVTPKMAALATAIASEKGVDAPDSSDFGAVRAFLNEHSRRQIGQAPSKGAGAEREA